ncbi:DgyrCDS13370 [Dimorphilus gyrociliatus]|nr:DgyrCDS13370 [Dimorphilus gyrociliatus]
MNITEGQTDVLLMVNGSKGIHYYCANDNCTEEYMYPKVYFKIVCELSQNSVVLKRESRNYIIGGQPQRSFRFSNLLPYRQYSVKLYMILYDKDFRQKIGQNGTALIQNFTTRQAGDTFTFLFFILLSLFSKCFFLVFLYINPMFIEPSALPEIPPGAFILDSDRRHLTILWKPLPIPFRNGPIAQYSLQISSEKSMTNVSGDVNYYKFKNLTTTNPSIKVIGFTKTQQISPLLNNSDHQFNLSKVSYDKEKSCFSVNKTSNGNRKIDWKIPGIKVSRYVIYYCIVEGPEALISEGCIVSNDSDWYGLKTIIVSNTTNFLVMNESLFMEDKIYDFGVSGDKFLNDKWHSTGLIPSTCLNRTQSDYKVETADQSSYLWILTIFFIIPIVGFVQFIKRLTREFKTDPMMKENLGKLLDKN